MPPTLITTLIFERFHVYEFRNGTHPTFHFALCLSTTERNYVREIKNVSFLPLIPEQPSRFSDPYRAVITPRSKGGTTHLVSRMHVVVDGIQSIGKGAFLPTDLGRITAAEEKDVRQKLGVWLGL